MKIGILTLPLDINYGGILQAYALQTILKKMGHDVVILDTAIVYEHYKLPYWKRIPVYIKRILLKLLQRDRVNVFYEKYKYNLSKEIHEFIRVYLNCIDARNIKKIYKLNLDAIVVGSDQIWRPKYNKDKIETSFLDFAKKWQIKRIAYAASFGTDSWEYTKKQTAKCKELLQKFDAVSVREGSGVAMCRKFLSYNAIQVLDPAFLLRRKDYLLLSSNCKSLCSKYIFVYLLDNTQKQKQLIENIAKEKNIEPYSIKISLNKKSLGFLREDILPPVERWIQSICNAEIVITDSFHACVFSIIFHKPFIVFDNSNRGNDRLLSLLSMFNLRQCLVSEDINSNYMNHLSWNWEQVDMILAKEVEKSNAFLSKNLL